MISIACVADRFGRNPNETGKKSASKIGSSTILAACWATRSRTVGIPNGRMPPLVSGSPPAAPARDDTTRPKVTRATRPTSGRPRSPPPRQGDPIHPGRAPVRPDPLPRLPQDVTPVDTVKQGMETPTLDCLAAAHSATLQFSHFHRRRPPTARTATTGDGLPGSLDRAPRPCPHAYPLRSRDQSRGPSLPARYVARRSAVLRPRRTPAALRRLSPSAYTTGLCPTRPAQTGLSCSGPDLAHVPPPLPRRRPAELTPDQGRPDMAFAVT